MHYKNGRAAHNGDKIINVLTGFAGVLHSASAQSDTCNGRMAHITGNDPYVTISECLHLEDIAKAHVPDSSAECAKK